MWFEMMSTNRFDPVFPVEERIIRQIPKILLGAWMNVPEWTVSLQSFEGLSLIWPTIESGLTSWLAGRAKVPNV